MLRNLSIILLITLTLLVLSCTSEQDKAAANLTVGTELRENIPVFFLTPPVSDQKIYGVGSANERYLSLSRTLALARARDDVARQVDLQVRNAITDYIQVAGTDDVQVIRFVETISRQVADVSLRGAIPTEVFRAEDGTIYALVEYDINNVTREAQNVFRRSEEAAFAEFKAAQALERLNFELRNNPTRSEPNSIRPSLTH